ncbi:MAG TPA: IS66 family insertion sequence element accessory protein TnpB, partial [Bradyrhizobium sp.]
MKQKSGPDKAPAEQVLKDIRRQTRRQYSAEEKIRIVLEGLRGEENISELCRREGIAASMYYGWSKEFLEAGKRRLAGDTARAATSGLAALVQQMFGLDPFSGAAFVFRAKRADRVKILVWDR